MSFFGKFDLLYFLETLLFDIRPFALLPTKCNFFDQTLVFLPLREPDLYIELLHLFFLGHYEQLE